MNFLRIGSIALVAAAVGFGAAWWLSGAPASDQDATSEREVLYWAAPMDPNFRSDKPGKSPMGMDLVPVYADSADAAAADGPGLRIDPVVVNNIGVKTAPVARGTLHRNIETVGLVTPDEERVSHVHVRAEGWIERLAADTEGQAVERGEELFQIYSPALVSAQSEYLQALNTGSDALIDAARRRLLALGMLPQQIEAVKQRRSVEESFEIRAPQDGFLLMLSVREGMYVQPGTTIMSLADLSEVWVDVDVFEKHIDWVREGQEAHMRLPFAPERVWTGLVDYVYPTIRPESRTARVRLRFDNPGLVLKPNMYAEVTLKVAPRRDALHVPTQAVIRAGGQSRVILALEDGRFRPAEVETGIESEGRTEIVASLSGDERVVVSGQFLIDSEASLDASLLRMLGDSSASTEEAGANGAEPGHAGHEDQGAPQGEGEDDIDRDSGHAHGDAS